MSLSVKRTARINHVRGQVEARRNDLVLLQGNLKRNFNIQNSFLMLANYAEASAILAWFSDSDRNRFREWAYAAGKLDFDLLQLKEEYRQPYTLFIRALWPLLSNDMRLVRNYFWFFENTYEVKRRNDLRTDEHLVEQLSHAISGKWDDLGLSCERWLAQEKLSQRQTRDVLDYKFLQGLSVKDCVLMTQALRAMVEQDELRKNAKFESGFTEDLISSKALIYAKVAWLHGLNVDIGSEFVPVEFLDWTCQPTSAIYDSIVK